MPILSDAELLYLRTRRRGSAARFVGITGTNGKSTTTALLHHMLVSAGWDSAAGGNLGTPALALPHLGDRGVYVLEMSSYMLERLASLRFDAAALLNLSPDHLDRHGDMAGYVAAKRHVFDRQGAADTAVLGIDDEATAGFVPALAGRRVLTVSGRAPGGCLVRAGRAPRRGRAAAADGRSARPARAAQRTERGGCRGDGAVARAPARRGRGRAALLSRACRIGSSAWPTVDGVPWVNDSKATNADAAARALACYGRIVWIAGGEAKAGGIESLRTLFPRIAHALLIGRDAELLAATLGNAGVRYDLCVTLERAMAAARDLAPLLGADVVLLSPACASFDQFSGFEARGERFAELARAAAPAIANDVREPA